MKRPLPLAALLALAAPALADPHDDAMLQCSKLADAAARLACYDRETARTRPVPAPDYAPQTPVPQHSFAPVTASATRPQKSGGFFSSLFGSDTRPPQVSVAQFGSEGIASRGEYALPRHQAGDTIDAISARVVSYDYPRDNRLVVTLDNGQKWIQITGGDPVGELKGSYTTQIRRGRSSGAYLMFLSGIPKGIYVRRMK